MVNANQANNQITKNSDRSKPLRFSDVIFISSFLDSILYQSFFSLSQNNIYVLYNKYTTIILTKNSPESSFISFACWKTIIWREMKSVPTNSGMFIKVFFTDLNRSEIIEVSTKKLKKLQTTLKKKAWVADPSKYQIQVKVCQEYIQPNATKLFASANKWGLLIYTHKSSQPIGNGLTIEIKFTLKRNVAMRNKNSAESKWR